jgi:hypothetical protein
MFVPCSIQRSRKNQHNAQICTTALFHTLAPTCFGRSLLSSGSFWIRLSYVKIQIDMVVYLKYITDNNQCVKHRLWKNKLNGVITPGPIQKLPEDGRLLPKHVGASI